MNLIQKADKSFLQNTPAKKVQLGQHIVDSMNANATKFPNLPYSNPSMKTANGALSIATANAKSGSHADIAARNNAEKIWNDIFGKTADYVSLLAAGDVSLITLAGFAPTSSESKPADKPAPAVLKSMTQHEGGVVEVDMTHPGAGKVAAYVYITMPEDLQAAAAADGTITIPLGAMGNITIKCDTHPSTTIGSLTAGKTLKLIVQPVNNKGTGGISTPKSFIPQP